jgi:hypothetical protein
MLSGLPLSQKLILERDMEKGLGLLSLEDHKGSELNMLKF